MQICMQPAHEDLDALQSAGCSRRVCTKRLQTRMARRSAAIMALVLKLVPSLCGADFYDVISKNGWNMANLPEFFAEKPRQLA